MEGSARRPPLGALEMPPAARPISKGACLRCAGQQRSITDPLPVDLGSQVTSELPVGVRLLQPGGTSSVGRTPMDLECVLPDAAWLYP